MQALKHLKNYILLFSAFTSSAKSEMVLCNKVQEYCYDNQNFLKCFNKIVLLFYKTEVLSEEVILKWYKEGHVPKGWTVFMEQMTGRNKQSRVNIYRFLYNDIGVGHTNS